MKNTKSEMGLITRIDWFAKIIFLIFKWMFNYWKWISNYHKSNHKYFGILLTIFLCIFCFRCQIDPFLFVFEKKLEGINERIRKKKKEEEKKEKTL